MKDVLRFVLRVKNRRREVQTKKNAERNAQRQIANCREWSCTRKKGKKGIEKKKSTVTAIHGAELAGQGILSIFVCVLSHRSQ